MVEDKTKFTFTFLLIIISLHAMSNEVSGTITDTRGEALIGVNVYLQGTYDGATTDPQGYYSFSTSYSGDQILVVSFIGFKSQEIAINLNTDIEVSVALKEEVNRLSGVTITAGSFEASDEKKAVIMKPLDIAMTAGGTADISVALSTLPGTTTNGESGRLFVRGGTAEETQAFIDGVLVHNFYDASPNNVPSRSRFSPFLFKGTYFSTGGYSAEFGQALSSVLSLTSNDMPNETRSDFSFLSVGGDVSHTQKWENGSIYGQLEYTNLDPYNEIINQTYDWEKGFRSAAGTVMLRQKITNDNMLKIYANLDRSGFIINAPNIDTKETDHIDLVNNNQYFNASYRHAIGTKSAGYLGISRGQMIEDIVINGQQIQDTRESFHVKSNFATDIAHVSFKAGGEVIDLKHAEDVSLEDGFTNQTDYQNTLVAGFAESDYYVTNSLTLRTGLRFSHYSLFDESQLSPRISMAYKTGKSGQISAAFGKFHQMPSSRLLIRSTNIHSEKADHYMISYQRIHNGRTLRAEIYRKKYDQLVKYDAGNPYNPLTYSNDGDGYAQGFDLFWRDSQTLKNIDYWITYSFLDSERNHRDFPTTAIPGFVAKHNVALVYKQFFAPLKTQVGASFRYNSGRNYNDPNETEFNSMTTKDFADLSFNFAYLHRPNIILYASATNLLGRDNVFGYEFESDPGDDGYFDSRAITQPAKRFLFIGLFITLTKDNTQNNLDNLN
jgi:hypothetical protein